MNMKQAKRIVAAYVAGLLVSPEALGWAEGMSSADSDRLWRAGELLRDEMLRRSGRADMSTATLGGLIADELAREI